MNSSLKNVFSFIKEALELKNKNIYNLSDYEIHEDLGQFYSKFNEIIEISDFEDLNINSERTILKLKYIKDEKKKKIPEISESLSPFIMLSENDIISKIDDLESKLSELNLLTEYKSFDKEIKEINRFNTLIDTYNSKYMQFYNIYKRIKDYEEKIEIIFGHKLMFWFDNQNNKINRYIYEAGLDIDVDPINNIISLTINNDKPKGFVSDFLNLDAYKIKNTSAFYDYIREFNDNFENDEFDVDGNAKKYINYISLENEIVDEQLDSNIELKSLVTYLFNNCGIIVRNKNVKLWIEDLDKIISMCDNTIFSSPILNMFEVDYSDDEQVDLLLNDSTYSDTKDDDTLFPLPSNDEQYKIVDKVKGSNIVLVQGPPGTGKSHTIANLISHYISEGKKVVVTSEKAKALEVLRDKIPSKIRSLCLSLLPSTGVDKDLEFSINNVIKNQREESELEKVKQSIDVLVNRLDDNHKLKQEVNEKIIDLMSKDTVSHKEKLNSIMNFESDGNLTLMDIARWLDKNRIYGIVPINDVENFNYVDCDEFFEKLDDICDDIKNNCFAISSSVPEYDKFNTNDIELYIKEKIGYSNYQLHNSQLVNFVKQSGLTEDTIGELGKLLSKISKVYKYFDKDFVKSNIKYEVFIKKLKEISLLISKNSDFIISTEDKMFDYDIVYDKNNVGFIINVFDEIIDLYDENENINIFNKLKLSALIKRLDNFKVNGNILVKDNVSKNMFIDLKMILNYHMLIDNIRRRLEQVLKVDLFNKMNIDSNQFGKYKNELKDVIDCFINYEEYVNEIDSCMESVINKNLFSVKYLENDDEYMDDIYRDLKYLVTEKSSFKSTEIIVEDIRKFYSSYNLQFLDKVLIAIETSQLEEFISSKNQLLREIGIINKYNELKKIYSKFVNDKKELIDNYIYKMSFEDRKFLRGNIDNILKYHYIEKYYLSLESKETSLPTLYSERNKLINEEKRIVTDLVSTKGWYYQNLNMTHAISLSLNKWVNLKKRLGSGKGKNSNLYLRQMREEMNTAKDAIPVWIMPIEKLLEQYPFTDEPPFDVLIMDESSQSSVFSISALARAKKVIIVGDDKQISPSNNFTSIDSLNDIRTKYLRKNSWDLQISKDTSIYDIIQTVCGSKKITLTEHFRCLPEIIHYSNKTFYNMEINPLKVRSQENTIPKPIDTIYVPHAVCKRSGTQIINEAEMNRIITLIDDISCDKDYDNKTIGIITLQNNMTKYIQILTEKIMRKFGEDFINERKIKVGITYDFQGDERDVIILSMGVSSIDANGDKYSFRALTTQEFDKSFNVAASRAKEQMILVHSVRLDELSPSCNRYKLLNYCLNYDSEKEKNIEKLFESNFERDIYYHLTSKGYILTPQFKIGNYRLDFVLTNDKNQKIAIECDGDTYHGIEELDNDLKRQSILERCGWKFVRIRASEYYYDREKSVGTLIELIEHYLNGNSSISFDFNNHIFDNNFDSCVNEDISLDIDEDADEEDNDDICSTNDNLNNNIKLDDDNKIMLNGDFAPSQFKYMVLFANGVSRRKISEYYNVAYDTVKKSLQVACEKYNVNTAEECVDVFNKQCKNTKEYNDILNDFNSSDYSNKNSKTCETTKMNKTIKHSNVDKIIEFVAHALLEKKDIEIKYSDNKKEFDLKPIKCFEAKNGSFYLKAIDKSSNQIKIFKVEKIHDIEID